MKSSECRQCQCMSRLYGASMETSVCSQYYWIVLLNSTIGCFVQTRWGHLHVVNTSVVQTRCRIHGSQCTTVGPEEVIYDCMVPLDKLLEHWVYYYLVISHINLTEGPEINYHFICDMFLVSKCCLVTRIQDMRTFINYGLGEL